MACSRKVRMSWSGDQLANVGEWLVDDRPAGTTHDDALGMAGGFWGGGGDQDSGLDQSLGEPLRSMASNASIAGGLPFSLSSVAFTNTMTRIVCLLARAGLFRARHRPSPWTRRRDDERTRHELSSSR